MKDQIVIMNSMEVIMMAFVVIVLGFYYLKEAYGKYTLPWILFSIPMLYFSINMVTECITADEYQYMTAFIDIENIANHTEPMKVIYEYRISQMIFGSVFKLVPYSIKNTLAIDSLVRVYKMVHWFFFFGIVLLISSIWRNNILEKNTNSIKFRIIDNIILYSLLALPVSCLIMKVDNYDASNVYFAVLGFSAIIAAEKKERMGYAYLGIVAATFGCMDKWVGCLYWCICVALFIYLGIQRNDFGCRNKFFYALKYCLVAIAIAVGISWINLLYLDILSGGLCVKINFGNILFPFVHLLRAAVFKDDTIEYVNEMAYGNESVGYLMIVMVMTLFFAFVCSGYDYVNKKFNGVLAKLLLYVNSFLLGLFIVGGGYRGLFHFTILGTN